MVMVIQSQRIGKTYMSQINKDQIKIIHTLVSKMKISDDDYRAMLSGYGVQSSTRLSFEQAVGFINLLATMAEKKGVYTKQYSNLGNRDDYAYPSQLRKIVMVWRTKSRMETDKDKDKALNSFLKNKFHIDRLEWLPRDKVGKVIKSIQSIKAQ